MVLHVPSFWVFMEQMQNHSTHTCKEVKIKKRLKLEEPNKFFSSTCRLVPVCCREQRLGWLTALLLMNMSELCHQSSVMNKSLQSRSTTAVWQRGKLSNWEHKPLNADYYSSWLLDCTVKKIYQAARGRLQFKEVNSKINLCSWDSNCRICSTLLWKYDIKFFHHADKSCDCPLVSEDFMTLCMFPTT